MQNDDLIVAEAKALACIREHRFQEAIENYLMIVKRVPEWENGNAYYGLACCYDDIGDGENAEACFQACLKVSPRNDNFIAGYAAFLYEHARYQDMIGLLKHLDRLSPSMEKIKQMAIEKSE